MRGVRGLGGEDLARVQDANRFCDLTWQAVHWTLEESESGVPKAIAMESPEKSWRWQFEEAKRAKEHPDLRNSVRDSWNKFRS